MSIDEQTKAARNIRAGFQKDAKRLERDGAPPEAVADALADAETMRKIADSLVIFGQVQKAVKTAFGKVGAEQPQRRRG